MIYAYLITVHFHARIYSCQGWQVSRPQHFRNAFLIDSLPLAKQLKIHHGHGNTVVHKSFKHCLLLNDRNTRYWMFNSLLLDISSEKKKQSIRWIWKKRRSCSCLSSSVSHYKSPPHRKKQLLVLGCLGWNLFWSGRTSFHLDSTVKWLTIPGWQIAWDETVYLPTYIDYKSKHSCR